MKNLLLPAVVKGVINAITEHRWEDALDLYPCCVCLDLEQKFMWRLLHLLMINCKSMTKERELTLLKLTILSGRNVFAGLEWFTHHMPVEDEELLEVFKQLLHQTKKDPSKEYFDKYLRAYLSLNNYCIWLTKLNHMRENIHTYDEDAVEDQSKELQKNGYIAFQQLRKALSKCTDSGTWIVGPLLHVWSVLKNKIIVDKFFRDSYDLDLLTKYIEDNWNDLSALRFSASYLLKHYATELLLGALLEQIAKLNPEDSLILEYVKLLLGIEINFGCQDLIKEEFFLLVTNTKDSVNSCHLQVGLENKIKSIELLTHLLEFPSWHKNVVAWRNLASLLNIFHLSWIRCWHCDGCISSRSCFETLAKKSLFPSLFYDKKLKISSEDEAIVACAIAYASFIFGYKPNTFLRISKQLKSFYPHWEKKLSDAVRIEGPRTKVLHRFIESLYNKCYMKELNGTSETSEYALTVKNNGKKAAFSIFFSPEQTSKMPL